MSELGEGYDYSPSAGSAYVEIEVVTAIMTRMGGSARRSEVARLIERRQPAIDELCHAVVANFLRPPKFQQ